jgi:replicative DNA helicase
MCIRDRFLGIQTGFEKIDEATAGLQGGQLITIIAPPKTGKSQIALRIANTVHENGYVPLFQSFEMNNHEQAQRADAMRAHISSNRLRRGKLSTAEETRYVKMLTEMSSKKPFHLVDAVNGLTIDSLVAKCEQLTPDILFVDGVYLMLDQVTGEANTPQALTNITRGLKRVAQKLNIPVVITTQTLLWKMKGGKVDANSIGYSSSFFQDSDVILGLEQIEDNDTARTLKIVQSRNCPPEDVSITWDWDTGCFHDETAHRSCRFCAAVQL